MNATLEADRSWIRDQASIPMSAGYVRLRARDASDGAAFERLIQVSVNAFLRFVRSNGFQNARKERGSGQTGIVPDGGEGDGIVNEIRSHVVVPWSVGQDHPLSAYWPYFYYPGELPGELRRVSDILIARLRTLTDGLFREIETQYGLARGHLTDVLDHGEGILRFHYYPPLPGGHLQVVPVRTGDAVIHQSVYQDAQGALRTWVSPHADIGHWTWQVAASDTRLAFQEGSEVAYPQSPGILVGNACTYLAESLPAVIAPVHWVDLSVAGPGERWSIAYFAHVRPGVRIGDEYAGERLYRDLCALGYASPDEADTIRKLLMRPECCDETVLRNISHYQK